jgi:hypothetical protein
MDNKPKWREGYKQLKKIIERLVRPGKSPLPQPALQPYRPDKDFRKHK